MEFSESKLLLCLPVDVAVRNGHTKHGTIVATLRDEEVQAVPPELRDELAFWIESDESLLIDAPTPDIATVVRALERAASRRAERAISDLLNQPDNVVVVEAPRLKMEGHPRVAEHLAIIADAANRKLAVRKALREYARCIPYLKRAASEPGYPIAGPALDHLTGEIAAFDQDAMVLAAASGEYQNAKVEVRKGATPYAFGVRDRVLDHIEKLPRPDLVDIVVDPISRYRRAIYKLHRGSMKWTLDEPVTVIPVRILSPLKDDRGIFFFADEDDRQRTVTGADDEIPF